MYVFNINIYILDAINFVVIQYKMGFCYTALLVLYLCINVCYSNNVVL